MADHTERSIEERVAALEERLERLQRVTNRLVEVVRSRFREMMPEPPAPRSGPAAVLGTERESPTDPPAFKREALEARTPEVIEGIRRRGAQYWIGRVGIALLLVGVAFLFKYAVDQGWLTPTIRVAFGLALGATLATVGVRVQREERWFTQVMFGGAAATWYITGFASFQLLHIVSYPVAFAFMVFVTVFTFAAGLRQDEASLAVLAAIGGLGTPFFLYTEAGSLPGLMAYTCLILIGTSALYMLKGWRSLLWTTVIGAWLVIALGFRNEVLADRVALQAAIVVIWWLFGLVPVLREVLATSQPANGTPPVPKVKAKSGGPPHDLAALTLATPALALFTSRAVWSLGDTLWGSVALAATAVYVLGFFRLRGRRDVAVLTAALGVTAAALAAIAFALLFEERVVVVLWAVEAMVLHAFVRQPAARGIAGADEAVLDIDVAAHLLHATVGIWLAYRIVETGAPETAILNTQAAAGAAIIATALVAAKLVEREATGWYQLAAHAAILGWLWRELGALPAGDGIVTATWGIYAIGLLLFMRSARSVAVATLFLAAGKLVVYDLSQVEPIWRILLFLGFGGVFLAISYYFTDLWNEAGDTEAPSEREGGP